MSPYGPDGGSGEAAPEWRWGDPAPGDVAPGDVAAGESGSGAPGFGDSGSATPGFGDAGPGGAPSGGFALDRPAGDAAEADEG
jgi:hypothetical protein